MREERKKKKKKKKSRNQQHPVLSLAVRVVTGHRAWVQLVER